MQKLILSLLATSICSQAYAHKSDLIGNDFIPNLFVPPAQLGGFDELVPYVLRAPDQEDAGSCLYMATTGIAEWWLAKLHPEKSRAPDGPLDLSERYLMNIAGVEEEDTHLPNWRTDSIFLFNQFGNKSYNNTAYRFTKNWYKGEAYSDKIIAAAPNEAGATYGTMFNWVNQLATITAPEVKLPVFDREVLFADPEQNQWNIGTAPTDIVERVKTALTTKKAPVLVVYNQNSYWHAVYVIGFNDNQSNQNCAYTEQFRNRIVARANELDQAARDAADPTVKAAYEIRAKRAHEAKTKIEEAYKRDGGCTSGKGVFYIRDSIYPEDSTPVYDYDLGNTGEEAPYSKKIVFKEYDWLRYFANNISVITVK